MTTTVTLKVAVDSRQYDDPHGWDWSALLDLGPNEVVEVASAADALRGALLAYLEETYELSDETRQDIEAVDLDEVAEYVLTEVWQ